MLAIWRLFFIQVLTVLRDTRNQFAQAHASCCALHRHVEPPHDVLLDTHVVSDSLGFVFDKHGRDIAASCWEIDRYAPVRRSRNEDNER
jgi:hypothetical protein